MTGERKILFTPEPDITAFELATIVSNLIAFIDEEGITNTLKNSPVLCLDEVWMKMSPGVRRHWTVQS